MLKQYVTDIKEYGLVNLLIYKVNQCLSRCTSGKCRLIKYYLYAQPVSETKRVKYPEKRKIQISLNHNVKELEDNPRPINVIRDRYQQGASCFVAKKDDVFIGFQWITTKDYLEDEVRCIFRPLPEKQSAWDFDIYIDPNYRMGLAFPMLWDAVDQHLRDQGVKWTMSRISPFNRASIGSHVRMGAVYRGQVLFLVLFGIQILLQGRFPYLDISISRLPVIPVSAPEYDELS